MKSPLLFWRRLKALICKEACQILRDRWSLAVAILLPLFLLLLFGYGMSMDVRDVELAIVCPVTTPQSNELIARFQASEYFHVAVVPSEQAALSRIIRHKSNAILYFPNDFDRRLQHSDLTLLLTQNAVNANQSRLAENYIRSIVSAYSQQVAALSGRATVASIRLEPRVWFNEANDSRYYLVPGVMVIIMTLIGALLTSLVMAREYEHGNLECIFMSPVRPTELLLAKAVNNFVLGMIGLGLSLLAARYLFGVPVRGSIAVLVGVSGAVSSGRAGAGTGGVERGQESVRRLPIDAGGDLPSGLHALRLHLRYRQPAVGGRMDQPGGPGALLRRIHANHLSGRKRLGCDRA